MIENSYAHFLTQRHRQLDDLSNVPEGRRAEHFLLRHLDPAVRSARHAVRLKIANDQVSMAINEAKRRLVRLRDALGHLQEANDGHTRSRMVRFRGGVKNVGVVQGL
jgi:hypothetical protein